MYVPEMSVISYVCKPDFSIPAFRKLSPGPFGSRILVSHILVHGTSSPGSQILANFRTRDPGF